ncbi:response regulator [bacterium]|nr:response regulator [bacterium]
MAKRLLFVDDELNILQGLKRMLRPMRHEWEADFAESGQRALELLEESQFDVVISDMRMPGMDGVELLTKVMNRYPETIRLVLSGHADQDKIMESIGPAHQYLSKPCSTDQLKTALDNMFELRGILSDDALRVVVSQIKSLPSLPSLYVELMQELQSPEVTMKRAGEIISRDVGMTAKILQLINSAFFGLGVTVSDPVHAAKLLGPEILKGLVLSVQVFSKFDDLTCKGLSLESFTNHCISVGSLAKKIVIQVSGDRKAADDAFVAGMLHDTGKLVFAAYLLEKFEQVLTLEAQDGWMSWEAERAVIGADHSEVGAYLLGLWGLPKPIVEGVHYHHHPAKCPSQDFGVLTAVHLGNGLVNCSAPYENGSVATQLDLQYLRKTGLSDELSIWMEMVDELRDV